MKSEIENNIDKLFILPIVMIIALLIFLVIKRHSPTIQHTFTVSMVVASIEIFIILVFSLMIPFGVGLVLFPYIIMMFSAWIVAIALIIGTALSAFIAWRHSKKPPRSTKFILKRPPPNDKDRES
ncbi:hypothetical protein [Conchiformibius steedae]|uniref:Uncharacterized protein n=1 Tax=Conchiformibius steedae TaxID=153493 RepID=A0A3P2A2U2_9NEIS|nr:hypothetical protein [Conchiformibius steedae]RRD89295.1 hypothetical protein EII21_09340 [Conchiformibius steedae]